ncbi:MAG TPA: hypothetical protein VHB47_21145 [Thermoanaerobaculia bacterium]|jgi:hypothetical protein|nr:hypothetical protein [Thermoanaerobaculia bacterium]
MNWFVALAVSVVLPLAAVASEEPKAREPAKESDEKPCLTHFTEEGSFFKGKTYKTWQEFPNADKAAVFQNVAQAVATNNWGSVNANKDLGIITAGQAVTMGSGSVAPLNVVVKQKSGGPVRVEASFGTGGMQRASSETVRTELCKLLEAAVE